MKKIVSLLLGFISLVASVSVAIATPSGATGTINYTSYTTYTPPSGSFSGAAGGGDGWSVAANTSRVFNVFHHDNLLGLMCHNQSDASSCWTTSQTANGSNVWKLITVTTTSVMINGVSTTIYTRPSGSTGSITFDTSGQPGMYLDPTTNYLYVYASRIDTGDQAGVVCIDVNATTDNIADPVCTGQNGEPQAWTPLTGVSDSAADTSGRGPINPVFYNGNFYVFNPFIGAVAGGSSSGKNALLCYSVINQGACTGQPYALSASLGTATNSDPYPGTPETLIGSQLFIPTRWSSGSYLVCENLTTTTPTNCAGSGSNTWPRTVTGASQVAAIPYICGAPGTDPNASCTSATSGQAIGVCEVASPSATTAWSCWSLSAQPMTAPANLVTTDANGAVLDGGAWTGAPTVIETKVFLADNTNGGQQVDCYDFATFNRCTAPGANTSGNDSATSIGGTKYYPVVFDSNMLSYIYTVTKDPNRATCLWVNANGGTSQIQNIDAYSGGNCGSAPMLVNVANTIPNASSCLPLTLTSISVVSTTASAANITSPSLSVTSSTGVTYLTPASSYAASSLSGTLPTWNLTPTTGIFGTQSPYPTPITTVAQIPQFFLALNSSTSLGTVTVGLTWTGADVPGCHTTTDTTQAASSIGSSGATLNGVITNPMTDTTQTWSFCLQTTPFASGGCTGRTVSAIAGSTTNSVTSYSAAVTGLTFGTTYYFEMIFTDSTTGLTLNGGVLAFMTTTPSTATTATTSASFVGLTTATLNGMITVPSSNTLTTVSFCYSATVFTSGTCTAHVISVTSGSPISSLTQYSASISGLTPSTTYYYELTIVDATTTSTMYGGTVAFVTPAPPTDQTSAASSVSWTTATLNATVNNAAGAVLSTPQFCVTTTSFSTGACTGTPVSAVLSSVSGSVTSYTLALSSLLPSTTYSFEFSITDTTLSPNVTMNGGVVTFTTLGLATASTTVASGISISGGVLNANVTNSAAASTSTPVFCYQATSFVTGACAGTTVAAAAGTPSGSVTPYSVAVTGLAPGTVIYFEFSITNTQLSPSSTARGGVMSFTATPLTITFNPNGGSGGPGSVNNPLPGSVLTIANYPVPTQSGFSFGGWCTTTATSSCGGVTYGGSGLTSYTVPSVNTTLYAIWIPLPQTGPPTFVVVFMPNGGTGVMGPQAVQTGQSLNANSFAKTGYTFTGWSTNATGGGTTLGNLAPYPFAMNLTLYAQWKTASAAPSTTSGQQIQIGTFYFATNSYALSSVAANAATLRAVVAAIGDGQYSKVVLVGSTDQRASATYNQWLSDRRVIATRQAIQAASAGVSVAYEIKADGIIHASTNMALDRRVTVYVVKKTN